MAQEAEVTMRELNTWLADEEMQAEFRLAIQQTNDFLDQASGSLHRLTTMADTIEGDATKLSQALLPAVGKPGFDLAGGPANGRTHQCWQGDGWPTRYQSFAVSIHGVDCQAASGHTADARSTH